MFAAHHRLSNLTAVIDANGLQSLDTVENTLSMHPLVDKFAAFGWDVHEVDGHNHTEILNAFQSSGIKPKAIIGHTVKGKGVSFMEGRLIGTTNLQLRMICEGFGGVKHCGMNSLWMNEYLKHNEKSFFVTADLGFGLVEQIKNNIGHGFLTLALQAVHDFGCGWFSSCRC